MHHRPLIPIFFLLLLLFPACGQPEQKLRIATAANMQYAMEELVVAFSEQTGTACEMITGSSGKLTAQIREGAPYDILVSADMMYPRELEELGLISGEPRIYAYGNIVLWTNREGIRPELQDLTDEAVKHIAIPTPQTAPYGRAAVEVLRGTGLYDRVAHKLVYGESVAQASQFIRSGASEIGITAKAVVLSANVAGKGQWTDLDPRMHSPIEQGVVRIRNSAMPDAANQFSEFLFSPEARRILKKFGYSVDE
ncbi:molybdate ABC transporter substrate-binding protein [Zeaxanthinibacter enoshimensis]|uniref:Molybdate transport system substrate-binding protein n=1 Tax=Zeaxanthinibacter enoshimensis TaxID=392009 RepID=A0A4R6TJB9_9FLAO|nr:molybdate ABC transporter substrate-binding protein [Zeaxanthinibacter enoshimensis]TDQ30954.1 molybdate transport system substrate-binding protein [Zeaxanthinibacter enoshimensis]